MRSGTQSNVSNVRHEDYKSPTPSAQEPKRLEAIPWARYCVKCQEAREQG
ncbi:MAG: hypothetical protein DMG96_13250 [Acidobacteria bacterium]|nr:MAG: hypothetical protein DMG96_13250 [Acidobacteriota bacterium]